MGIYDINSEYSADLKISLYSLAKELSDEYTEKEKGFSQDDCEKKLKSIIKNIKKTWHIDLKKIAEQNKLFEFQMYQVLKIIFNIQKGDEKFSIIKMIAEPHMKNLWTEYADGKEHWDKYISFLDQISQLCNNHDIEQYKQLYDQLPPIINRWNRLIELPLRALDIKEDGKICQYVNKNYYNKIYICIEKEKNFWANMVKILDEYDEKGNVSDDDEELIHYYQEFKSNLGLLEVIYYKVFSYRYSITIDYVNIHESFNKLQQEHPIKRQPSWDYLRRYANTSRYIGENGDKALKDMLNGKNSELGESLWNLITYDNYDENDIKSYEFAVEYYLIVMRHIYKPSMDEMNRTEEENNATYNPYKDAVGQMYIDHLKKGGILGEDVVDWTLTPMAISIIQALIYIHKYNVKSYTQQYKHSGGARSLTAAIKDISSASASDTIFIKLIVYGFKNANIGYYDIYETCRDIENKFSHIKKYVFGDNLYRLLMLENPIYSVIRKAIGEDFISMYKKKLPLHLSEKSYDITNDDLS